MQSRWTEDPGGHEFGSVVEMEISMEKIPNWAARIFALGIVCIVVGVIASALTDHHLTKLLVVIGLGLMAMGQQLGERSISGEPRAPSPQAKEDN